MRPLTFQVLQKLSTEKFVSGVALAQAFGVSRSAISDAVKDATTAGVEIFSLTRRGYRLAEPIELLDIATVRANLGDAAPHLKIEIVDSIGSTNSEMQKRAAAGEPGGSCLVAEIQTAGRGRRGRVWQSAFHSSLTFSLLWRFEKGAAQLGGLSLVVGVALVRALRACGVREAALKWPNDVIVDHRKLAGVLIETQGDMLGPTAATIGCGINVKLSAALERDIGQPVTDVAAHAEGPVSRNLLLAAILRELVPALSKFNAYGFAGFRDEWLGLHALHREVINVSANELPPYEATVVDVADDGSLIVEREGKRILLSSAEISVRKKAKTGKVAR
jgi:BirA family transcriptional regulator, biotin operon repressor / biotin---[acetyl-CoA-carboxylase] ligase